MRQVQVADSDVSDRPELDGRHVENRPDAYARKAEATEACPTKPWRRRARPPQDSGFFLEAHVKLRPVDFATDVSPVPLPARSARFSAVRIVRSLAAPTGQRLTLPGACAGEDQ